MRWGAVALALLPSALALAGPQSAGPQTSARPQFTTRTDLVTVDVTAFDQQSRPIEGLTSSDFTVRVDGTPRRSGKPSFDESRESVVRKVRSAIGVYHPLSDPASPGFWEFNLLDRRQGTLDFIRALQDLLLALQPVEGPKHVVIVSGGGWMDTTNLGLIREVATLATSSRTQIHAMHVRPLPGAAARADVRDMPSECRDERVLSTGGAAYELSLLTGGLADQPTEGLIEGAAFDQLARQLSQWYLLGFEPADSDRDGRPHRIEVQLTTRPDVTVRAGRMLYVEAGVVAARKTRKPPPPPALEWNDDAERRTRLGLPPFAWMPEWADDDRGCSAARTLAGVRSTGADTRRLGTCGATTANRVSG